MTLLFYLQIDKFLFLMQIWLGRKKFLSVRQMSQKLLSFLTLPKECLMRPDHMSLIILWEMQGFLANNTSEVLCQIVLTWQNRTYQKCWICKSFFLLLLRLQDFPNQPLLTVCLFYLTLSPSTFSHILQTLSSM